MNATETTEKIDPRTGYLARKTVWIDDPYGRADLPEDRDSCTGKLWFWSDSAGELPAVLNSELRAEYPEISDDEWSQLSEAAHMRAVEAVR